MNKRDWGTALSLLFGVALLIIVLSQFPVMDVFNSFSNISIKLILYYLLSVFAILFFSTLRWYYVLKSQNAHIKLWHLFAYRMVGSAMSYLTPGPKVGGEFFQSAVMKKEKISFTQRLSSIVIDRTVELSSSGVFFIVGIIVGIAILPFDMSWQTRAALVIVCFLMLYIIYWFFRQMFAGRSVFHRIFRWLQLHKFKKCEQYEQKVIDFEQFIIKFYTRDKRHFLISIGLTFATWIAMFAEYYFLLSMFNVPATALSIFLVISFVGFAYLLPMPMALGTLEAGQVSAFAILNASTTTGIGVALIIRAKDIFLSLIGVFFMALFGIKYKNIRAKEQRRDYIRTITKF